MTLSKLAAAIIVTLMLSGCLVKYPDPIYVADTFDADEITWFTNPTSENSFIRGKAFIRKFNGGQANCVGGTVYLIPDSGYARARILAQFKDVTVGFAPVSFTGSRLIDLLSKANSQYQNTILENSCDGAGRFKFSNIPAGTYYLTTTITYKDIFYTGGIIMKRVTVEPNETKEILLTF